MKPVYSGKVREIYEAGEDRLVIVTTDRISAFDHILPVEVPGKGVVLNTLSNFWFEKTRHIVLNHIVSVREEELPEGFRGEEFAGRTVLTERLEMLPFEFVVRGYCFGSLWKICRSGGKYELAQKLEEPVLTPAVKRDTGHDEYVDMGEVEKALGKPLAGRIQEICLALYKLGSKHALERGLIIADAKFEFGRNARGELALGDELFTPDSSRFWDAKEYRVGISPPSYDKQVLRDWLAEHGMDFDHVPERVLRRTEEIYRECLERITG